MAEILPFRGWRYNPSLTDEIDGLTSPLFDVVSKKQREKLFHNPLNSIHLSVPEGPEEAKTVLEEWKLNNILLQDELPTIYVYYQYFSLTGSDKTYCRKGFVCNIRIYNWDEKVLLRHENTIPGAVNDRIDILKATQLNVSPTHGLYTDPSHELEKYMDECIRMPLYDKEDYQGVRDVMGIIQDRDVINEFVRILRDKQIILADGHHRYEGSLLYKKQMSHTQPKGHNGFNYHMMYLTNTESDDLKILPTHRLIHDLKDLDETTVMKKLTADFSVTPVEEPHLLADIIAGKPWAFGLIFKENAFKIILKPERVDSIPWKFSREVNALDLTVLHYFIIEKALGIPGKMQRSSDKIRFERSFPECLAEVIQGEAQLAILTNGVSMDQVKKVCYSGHTLPQKSTYFYPKVICGYVFSSIKNGEFQQATDPCLGLPAAE